MSLPSPRSTPLTPRTLTVLPDRARAEERLLLLARAGTLVAHRPVWTLRELERELVRAAVAAGACAPICPPQAERLALRKAARDATPPGSPFASLREDAAYARALGELDAALVQGLADPEELLARAAELPAGARERAVALCRALVAGRAELRRAKLSAPHRALHVAVLALERGLPLPAELAGAARLDFELIHDWPPLRQRLLVAIAARLPDGAAVRVHLPWAAGRPELTAALEPALRAFEALGASHSAGAARIELVLTDPGEASPLAPFLGRLFTRSEAVEETARVVVRSCATPAAQAREAANACADAAARGTPLSALAIAARSLSGGIAEELGAALDRLGLPWRERRGRPALTAWPARLALLPYELLERNFPREELLSLLTSPPFQGAGHAERVAPHRLVHWLREARIRDDASDEPASQQGGVVEKLARLEEQLKLGDAGERDTAEIARARQLAARTIAEVRSLPERATIAAHARALVQLQARWGFAQAVARPGASSLASAGAGQRDRVAHEAVQRVLAELVQAAQALGRGAEPLSRASFAELVHEALADESLPASGARGAAVELVELRELAGRSFAQVVLVGLVDGELPARASPDALLSDDDKRGWNRVLGRAVFRLPDSQDDGAPRLLPARQAEEPLLFHLGLCAARDSLLLLWPRADAKGSELLRSPFAEEAQRALGRPEERALLAAIPLPGDCRVPGELLARAALEAFAAPAFRISPPLPDAEALPLLHALLSSALGPRMINLSRAASAERERLRAFVDGEPGRFSGRLTGASLAAAREELRFSPEAPLSARQLEQHATCGFKLFASKLLKIPDAAEQSDELAALQRGNLFHRCLERFFARLAREGRLPLKPACREEELQTLAEETEAALEAFAAEEPVGHVALWKLGRREVHQRLARLVDAERDQPGVPRDLELAFGEAQGLPALRLLSPAGDEVVHVRGRIDRVDELPGNAQLVLDYKSGGVDGIRKKLRAETLCLPEFQLPLYAAAVQQARPGVRVDAGYISIKSAERPKATLRKTAGDAEALLATEPQERARLRGLERPPLNLADQVWHRVSLMRAGRFPVAPLTCEHCDLTSICRIVALPVEDDE